jgi:RNA polymerase sigma factor (sigma-70 family)
VNGGDEADEDRPEHHVRWAMMQALCVIVAQGAPPDVKKDAIAEGLRAMCLAWKRYDPALGAFEPFAQKRVIGAVRRFLKQDRRRRAVEVLHDYAEEIDAGLEGPGDAWSRLTQEVNAAAEAIATTRALRQPDEDVVAELARCTEGERALYDAVYVQGLTWEETGALLGMKAEQARYLDKKLRKKLAPALARRRGKQR